MFDGDGTPLRATINLSLKQIFLAASAQNPTSGGTALLGSHLVREGDTLASVAQRLDGHPKYWRLWPRPTASMTRRACGPGPSSSCRPSKSWMRWPDD